MRINWSKVLLGGIIAGVVLIAIDWVSRTFWLGPLATAEFDAFKPGISAAMMAGNAKIVFPLADIVLGVTLVWVYAAIRPRFGPGPRTAICAAIPLWIASCIAYYGDLSMGMMSARLWWMFALVGLVAMILATMAGAKFYSEEAAA
jgi:hypothetical protein